MDELERAEVDDTLAMHRQIEAPRRFAWRTGMQPAARPTVRRDGSDVETDQSSFAPSLPLCGR